MLKHAIPPKTLRSLLPLTRVQVATFARRSAFVSLFAFALMENVALTQDYELSSTVPIDTPNISSRTYYDGAETLGRVGHEAILRRDILHQIKKGAHLQYLEEIEKVPEDKREEVRQQYKEGILNQYLNSDVVFSQILDNHIRKLLFYNDYVVSRPKDQVKEQTAQLEKEFDKKVLPDLMEKCHCKNLKELTEYFENEIQSDFEQEKRIFLQQTLGELWMNYNLGEEDFEPTLTDLKRYYDANSSLYSIEDKVRWQSMTVYYGSDKTKDEARKKIAHMGNSVQDVKLKDQEKMFAEVCRVDSEDSYADQGGVHDWTARGVIRAKQVEDAVFSKDLPVGSMSKIIETDSSFTIVRVLERELERTKSFSEVQDQVRDNLIEARTEAMKKKYEEKLAERFKVEIYALTPEDREKCFRSAPREATSATGRAPVY